MLLKLRRLGPSSSSSSSFTGLKRPSILSLSFNGVSIGTHCTARNFTIHRTTFSFRGLSSRKCFPSVYFANRNTVRSRTLLQNLDTVSLLFFLYSLYIDFSFPAIFLLLLRLLPFLFFFFKF